MAKYDRLNRVVVGRDKDVPVEGLTGLWFLLISKDGNWDAVTNTDLTEGIVKEFETIFCIWHGTHRTNLFLMDKTDLIKRISQKKRTKWKRFTNERTWKVR